jgi:hypothetical protein
VRRWIQLSAEHMDYVWVARDGRRGEDLDLCAQPSRARAVVSAAEDLQRDLGSGPRIGSEPNRPETAIPKVTDQPESAKVSARRELCDDVERPLASTRV